MLDSKSERCIFTGYKDGLKGYKLWNLETRKVVYNLLGICNQQDWQSPITETTSFQPTLGF